MAGINVPVMITSGGRPVRDLRPDDVFLTDSGVLQEVVAVDGTALALDLTVVVESLSGGLPGVRDFDQEINGIVKSGHPHDRVRLMLAGTHPRVAQRQLNGGVRDDELLERGCAPVYDVLASALMQPVDPNRQHVVVLLSVGEGSGGVLRSEVVAAIARRSSALLFAVSLEPAWNLGPSGMRTYVARAVCANPLTDWSPARQPRLRQLEATPSAFTQARELWLESKNRLVAIAELTGGREIRPTVLTQNTTGPIREVLDEARASYILRYTPKGVPDTGWHPITVKINRPGNYDIRVRPGYER